MITWYCLCYVQVIHRHLQPLVKNESGERVRVSPSVQGGWQPGMAAHMQPAGTS